MKPSEAVPFLEKVLEMKCCNVGSVDVHFSIEGREREAYQLAISLLKEASTPKLRVLRLLEYTYPNAAAMEKDMQRWAVQGQSSRSPGSTIKSVTLPLEVLNLSSASGTHERQREALVAALRFSWSPGNAEKEADRLLHILKEA